MEKTFSKKPLAIAIGAAFAATLGASTLASAETSPFAAKDMTAGYLLVADNGEAAAEAEPAATEGEDAAEAEGEKEGEGKCGEGKCGEDKKDGEGKCGEGKCGEDKAE